MTAYNNNRQTKSAVRDAGRFNINDRVRHSGYATLGLRDWWLSRGRTSEKQSAREAYDAKCAMRGTITEVNKTYITVTWDNGSISQCLDYLVERAA